MLRNTPFTFTYAATSAAGSGGAPNVFFSTPLPTPTQGTPAVAGTIAAVDTDLKSSYLHQYNVDGRAAVLGRLGDRRLRRIQGAADVDGRAEPELRAAGAGAINPRRYYAATAPNLTTLGMLRSAGEQDYNACSWPSRGARAAA